MAATTSFEATFASGRPIGGFIAEQAESGRYPAIILLSGIGGMLPVPGGSGAVRRGGNRRRRTRLDDAREGSRRRGRPSGCRRLRSLLKGTGLRRPRAHRAQRVLAGEERSPSWAWASYLTSARESFSTGIHSTSAKSRTPSTWAPRRGWRALRPGRAAFDAPDLAPWRRRHRGADRPGLPIPGPPQRAPQGVRAEAVRRHRPRLHAIRRSAGPLVARPTRGRRLP